MKVEMDPDTRFSSRPEHPDVQIRARHGDEIGPSAVLPGSTHNRVSGARTLLAACATGDPHRLWFACGTGLRDPGAGGNSVKAASLAGALATAAQCRNPHS